MKNIDFKETSISYINTDNYAIFSSSEQKWINKMLRLQEQYPDAVKIKYAPENNNGMLLAHIPKSWLKIKPPARREMTEEQRAQAAIRMANVRAKHLGSKL